MVKTILIVDDSSQEVESVRNALLRMGIAAPLFHVQDAESALAYLRGHGKFSDRGQFALPEIILLDVHLPRSAAFEILQWIRNQTELARTIVIILARSEDRALIQLAYQMGATSFLLRDPNAEELRNMANFLRSSAAVFGHLPGAAASDAAQ